MGARNALPIVGGVFQQALRNRWLDASAEFDVPRPKPKPVERNPVRDFIGKLFGNILRHSVDAR